MTTAPADNAKHASPPESPTTVRPFEMDDDDAADTSVVVEDSRPTQTTAATAATAPTAAAPPADAPPAKPPRPQTEQQKNETMLKEAFPSVDLVVIKAILSASRGQIEPAFNALLEMTDPDAAKDEPEDVPPPQPPRPDASARSQLEADERLARQLAEHYENVSAYEARTQNRSQGQARGQGHQQGHQQQAGDYPARGSSRAQQQPHHHHHSGDPRPLSQQDREYSFIDDDLPIIRDQVRKGFVETQTKVNGWINVLKKKIDETFEEGVDGHSHGAGSASAAGPSGFGGRTFGGPTVRPRSSDYDRYDADPEVLSDDFAGIKLAPDGTASPHNRSSVFKPPPPSTSPRPSERKVGFKDETEDIYSISPRFSPKDGPPASSGSALKPATKASKWQPLATVESTPMAENDPFSLGDSDDEKEMIKDAAASSGGGSSGAATSKPPSAQDSERLKKAAAEAMSESLVEGGGGAAGDATAAARKD
jgi:hypothetical protein